LEIGPYLGCNSKVRTVINNQTIEELYLYLKGPVHSAYNPSFSACFFNRNNIFLSQQISQQYFLAGLSAQPNGKQVRKGKMQATRHEWLQ
jgi:hypothetical protein